MGRGGRDHRIESAPSRLCRALSSSRLVPSKVTCVRARGRVSDEEEMFGSWETQGGIEREEEVVA